MPVNAQLVSTMYAYGFSGVPHSFSAKTEAVSTDVASDGATTHQQLRRHRSYRSILFWILGI